METGIKWQNAARSNKKDRFRWGDLLTLTASYPVGWGVGYGKKWGGVRRRHSTVWTTNTYVFFKLVRCMGYPKNRGGI